MLLDGMQRRRKQEGKDLHFIYLLCALRAGSTYNGGSVLCTRIRVRCLCYVFFLWEQQLLGRKCTYD